MTHPRWAPSALARASLLACLLVATTAARAEPVYSISSRGDCPSAAEVAKRLSPLLHGARVVIASTPSEHGRVALHDDGPAYGLWLQGRSTAGEPVTLVRAFADPARACAERANAVAVVVALELHRPSRASATRGEKPASDAVKAKDAPATKPAAPPPGAPSPTIGSAPNAAPAPTAASCLSFCTNLPRFAFEVSAGVLAATGFSGPMPSPPALAFRVALGTPTWMGIFGLSGFGDARFTFPSAVVEIGTLMLLDVSVRWRRALGPWELAADLGPTLALYKVQGVDFARPNLQREPVGGLGVRAGVSLRYWVTKTLAPFFALSATWLPAQELHAEPVGFIGALPRFWLGASLGLALGYR